MSTPEKQAIYSAIAVLALGLFMAFYWKEGHWFARSGALVSVIAVFFASLQLRSRVAKAPVFVEEGLENFLRNSQKQVADAGFSDAKSKKHGEQLVREVRQEAGEAVQKASRRLYLVELWLFVIGTLVWGVADLPLDWWFRK